MLTHFEVVAKIDFDLFHRISDASISNLFACQQGLCNQKFELKINNVRFVGHPITLQHTVDASKTNQDHPDVSNQMLNVVFALKAQASHEIVHQYHELSKKIATSICR